MVVGYGIVAVESLRHVKEGGIYIGFYKLGISVQFIGNGGKKEILGILLEVVISLDEEYIKLCRGYGRESHSVLVHGSAGGCVRILGLGRGFGSKRFASLACGALGFLSCLLLSFGLIKNFLYGLHPSVQLILILIICDRVQFDRSAVFCLSNLIQSRLNLGYRLCGGIFIGRHPKSERHR